MAQIDLPGKGPVQGYQTSPEGSMAAAAAPWQALGGVGREVQQIGEQAADFAVKLQRIKNVEMANNLEIAANEEFSAFQNEILTNPDPSSWGPAWEKRLEGLKKAHLPDGLAPEQRAMLGERFAEFSSRTGMKVLETATVTQIDQARRSFGNRIDQRLRMGDADGADAAADEMHSLGLIDEPARDKLKSEISRKSTVSAIESAAQQDPAETKKLLREKNDDGTWANFPDIEPADRNRLDGVADESAREIAYQTVETFNNGRLDGSITRPEQIEQKFPGASATLKLRMKEDIERDITDAQRRMVATPEYQATVTGKVSAMLDSYSVEMVDFDAQFYEMDTMIRTLPEGPTKARLNDRLDKVRNNQLSEWKDSADEWREKFGDAYKSGAFGLGVSRQPVQKIIADGILDDEAKLIGAGMSPEQAAAVKEAKPEEKISTFRKNFKERAGFANDDETSRAALEVIASGNEGFVDYPDPVANQQAEQKYGKAVDEFERWYRVNKDADSKTIERKFYSLLSPEGAKRFSEMVLPGMVLPPKENDQ